MTPWGVQLAAWWPVWFAAAGLAFTALAVYAVNKRGPGSAGPAPAHDERTCPCLLCAAIRQSRALPSAGAWRRGRPR